MQRHWAIVVEEAESHTPTTSMGVANLYIALAVFVLMNLVENEILLPFLVV